MAKEHTHCTRCGQPIINVAFYKGQPYGTECIKAVTGRDYDPANLDPETREYDPDRKARAAHAARAERERKDAALRERVLAAREANAWVLGWLRPIAPVAAITQEVRPEGGLRHKRWDDPFEAPISYTTGYCAPGFLASVRRELDFGGKRWTELPERALQTLADVYAKGQGRRGSRAYEAAWAEFWAKVEEGRQA